MPIYEYLCSDCGCEFEVLQKISDPAPPCQACHPHETARDLPDQDSISVAARGGTKPRLNRDSEGTAGSALPAAIDGYAERPGEDALAQGAWWRSRDAILLSRRRCLGAWLNSAARNVRTSSHAKLGPTVRPPRQIRFM